MPTTSRTFRIFVSSTFSDLKAERGALQERVFPRLRALAAEHGCRFQVIDLRWGVSEEAALDQQTMAICLGEVERCQKVSPRPNFVILLGNRYGWRPLPAAFPAAEFDQLLPLVALADQDALLTWYQRDDNALPPVHLLQPRTGAYEAYEAWEPVESRLRIILEGAAQKAHLPAASLVKYTASATEQEIVAGALQVPDASEHVFCFFRDIQGLPDDPATASFREADPAAAQKQAELKARLRQQLPGNVHEYQAQWQGDQPALEHLDRLCEDVYVELSALILAETGRLEAVDALEQETAAHAAFAAERARVFIGRAELLTAIQHYLAGSDPHALAVWGVSGSGKSALMARAVAQAQQRGQEVLYRFIGATPPSSSGRALLESLCRQISRRYGADEATLPSEYKDLVQEFPKRLALATPAQPLILFLDALDQLSDADNARRLTWLPAQLPPNVRVVLSTLPGECLQALESKTPLPNRLEVQPLAARDGEAILDAWLDGVQRQLQANQKRHLLEKFAGCGLPLYLKLAFEEARLWKSYTPLPDLSADIPGLLRDLFERLAREANHGGVLVSRGLGYLAAARNGLSEDELLDVLSRDAEVLADFRRRSPKSPRVERLPVVVWSRLYFDLEPYLAERSADGTSLLTFYHRQMAEACQSAYRDPARHAGLAAYFNDQSLYLQAHEQAPNLRKLSEMVYQQACAGLAQQVEKTLLDFGYVQAKLAGQGIQALIEDYDLVHQAGVEKARERALFLLQGALRLSAHVLSKDPLQLPGQLTGRLLGIEKSDLRELLEQIRQVVQYPWVRPLHACLDAPGGALVRSLVGHTAVVSAVAVTPDGRRAISAAEDKTLKVWDLESGACIHTLEGHTNRVYAVALTPDGQRAISGSEDKTLKLWDLETGRCLRTLEGHYDWIKAVAVTPDGRRALSGSIHDDRSLRLWDLESGECLRTMRHRDYVNAVAVTPDGRRAVSGEGGDWRNPSTTLSVWDLETGECLQTMEGHTEKIHAVALTPDSGRAVSACGDGTLKLWDLQTGACLRTLEGHAGNVNCVAVTPDGRRAISGSFDATLKIWDLQTGACLSTLGGHTGSIYGVALTPDGRQVISGSRDASLKIWDLERAENSPSQPILEEHAKQVNIVAVTPDGQHGVSGSDDTTLKVWEVESGACLHTLQGHTSEVTAVALTPDGRRVISGTSQFGAQTKQVLKLWNLETGECIRTLEGHTKSITAVALSPDGQRAISTSEDGTLKEWSLESGECLAVMDMHAYELNKVKVHTAIFTPDGKRVVSGSGFTYYPKGSNINTVNVWDLKSHICVSNLDGHTLSVGVVLITPDGQRVVAGSKDWTLTVWDLQIGTCLHTLEGHSKAVDAVALTPDGRRVISGSSDTTLKVWNLESGDCLHTLEGHTQGVSAVAVTPDGCWIVSGSGSLMASGDHALKVWNTESGDCLMSFECNGAINCLAIAPDGCTIVAGDQGGRVYFLRMENVTLSPPFITAWQFSFDNDPANKKPWWQPKKKLPPVFAFGCPHCRNWAEIPESAPGSEIACPSCGKPVKLNPFTIQGDWRPIAKAWHGEG